MKISAYLDVLHTAQRLKDATRHCDTAGGRRESVAEHSWRLALMAMLLEDEFPEADLLRLIKMCLIHDLGEAFTGDIPVFLKTEADRQKEASLLNDFVQTLEEPYRTEFTDLYREMEERKTLEAKLYKALDGMEALLQHNEAPLSSWEPHEYELQMTYCSDRVGFSEWITALREQLRQDSLDKIKNESI